MSTNSECAFIEVKPGQWFMILEDYDAPKNAWDWREYAQAYGPFQTQEQAHAFLRRHFANPGGCTVSRYREDYKPDEVSQRLFDEAPERTRDVERHSLGHGIWRF